MKSIRFIISSFIIILISGSVVADPPQDKVGVLVLAHGGNEEWNMTVIDAAIPLRKIYPVEIAFGMALPRTMQEGIDKLEAQGVNKIVVVPLFVSSYSFIIRQNEYLLNKRDELADPPLVMDHSMDMSGMSNSNGGQENSNHQHMDHTMDHDMDGDNKMKEMDHSPHHQQPQTLERLRTNSQILLTKPLDNHPLVAEILLENIHEMSSNPSSETVIIVGHGPVKESDNKNWVMTMEDLADQIRNMQTKDAEDFKLILCTTVRDDADENIYNQAKENLRAIVRQAGKYGEVIIVPQLLSKGGIEKGILDRLEGLDYHWTGKMLAPHENISRFIQTSVSDALKKG